jgi:hypothetical protein
MVWPKVITPSGTVVFLILCFTKQVECSTILLCSLIAASPQT